MKKTLTILWIVIVTVGLYGCVFARGWSEKDLVFYNEEGDIIAQPNAGGVAETRIDLNDAGEDAQTHRGVKIGDDAKEALKEYNLKDSKFYIIDNETDTENEKLTALYRSLAPDGQDLVSFLEEIDDRDCSVLFITYIYKQNGRLVTRSKLDYDELPSKSAAAIAEFERKRLYNIFYIKTHEMKISYISTWNRYYYELCLARLHNDGVMPDTEDYEWLKLLGQ